MTEITELHLMEISLIDEEPVFPGCRVISIDRGSDDVRQP
jgi:hypothetical protein